MIKKIIINIKEELLLIFLVFFCFSFIMSLEYVPSDSMMPTLEVGDYLLISKLSYTYRSPEREEMVVFEGPDHTKWIKRVVGLPGEVVDIREGNIYINNVKVDETAYVAAEEQSTPTTFEDAITFPYIIPEDSFFVLGDNRLASKDSRYIGAVKEVDIIGCAVFRIFPFKKIGKLA